MATAGLAKAAQPAEPSGPWQGAEALPWAPVEWGDFLFFALRLLPVTLSWHTAALCCGSARLVVGMALLFLAAPLSKALMHIPGGPKWEPNRDKALR